MSVTDGHENGQLPRRKAAYWCGHLERGTIIAAIRQDPKQARAFFGSLPVMREDVAELSRIAFAKQILKCDGPEQVMTLIVSGARRRALERGIEFNREEFTEGLLIGKDQFKLLRANAVGALTSGVAGQSKLRN